ncbi:hypothetical protein [Mesorhizobium sp. L48C026A00]|uniref:hypothetical protein n=1 Tax=Mesorhizobium sp. L48C026A00 TaxID=1287182 RepID=UPI0003CFAC73|nr:hypothetical protein [Mesorhizobium sp. L48C026A00]ESZ15212.1 hypothetical protein X737_22030 [Mesorhizobium sp. L48C026A00]
MDRLRSAIPAEIRARENKLQSISEADRGPKGQARIRTQMSAAHSSADIDRAVEAFGAVGRELGVIS